MRFGSDLRPEEVDVMHRVSGLPVDVSAMSVVSNIWRAGQALKSSAERGVLRAHGMTWASFSTLYIVWIWGPIETRAIARSQGVSRPTITSTVDTLEKRGLVKRREHPGDRRLVMVELTDAGRHLIERVYPEFNRREAQLVSVLREDERDELAVLLRRVIASAAQPDEAVDAGVAEAEIAGQGV